MKRQWQQNNKRRTEKKNHHRHKNVCRNNGRNHKRIQRPVLKRDEAFSVVISFFEINSFF